jgi:hypothetical protein
MLSRMPVRAARLVTVVAVRSAACSIPRQQRSTHHRQSSRRSGRTQRHSDTSSCGTERTEHAACAANTPWPKQV